MTASFNASLAAKRPATSSHLTFGFSETMAPCRAPRNFPFSLSSASSVHGATTASAAGGGGATTATTTAGGGGGATTGGGGATTAGGGGGGIGRVR